MFRIQFRLGIVIEESIKDYIRCCLKYHEFQDKGYI